MARRVSITIAIVAAVGLLSASAPASAAADVSTDAVWQPVDRAGLSRAEVEARVRPTDYRVYRVTPVALEKVLATAPREFSAEAARGWSEISLPMPDGSYARFRFVESPIMAAELAAKYPALQTYLGQGIDDPAATVRFDRTPAGFHAQILSPAGAVYIDPFGGTDSALHMSYYRRDRGEPAAPFWSDVLVNPDYVRIERGGDARSGEWLKTYRLACAANGEYTIYHGGTVELGLAAVVTAINRVTGIYEAEFAIRLELVANNDLIVYTDPDTDPYTNSDSSAMLAENQANLDAVIGTDNYDMGHVFSTGGGGLAYTPCVCHSLYKAGAVTGSSTPEGDSFWVDYVAHEMGHQFGGNHSFNNDVSGSCSGTRNAATAYEPGSGSTIMAYAGICDPENLQENSDAYFHSGSIGEIRNYVDVGWGSTCSVDTTTGNTAPTVDAGADYTIPSNTPFELTAVGNDADGDPITYCWEQRDLGPPALLSDPDDGSIPLFRSWMPTTDPTRTFPRLEDLVQNTFALGEQMPTTNRTMNFRATVRDNRAGGGGMVFDDMQVTVDTNGMFVVDAPNDGTEEWDGPTEEVTWSSTTEWPPFNVEFVNVLLSVDGGYTYPYTLAENVLNGPGFAEVNVPEGLYSTTARVKVEAVGNIFFDISNFNFTVNTVPSGACCAGDGTCTVEAEAACLASGGTYQGDDTDCDPNPCPQPQLIQAWNMDTDPAWSTEGLWAWGQPTGGGGAQGNPDPTSGYTGTNVYGYNLAGDYEADLPERHLTTSAIDCTGLQSVSLKFWCWLNVESNEYDHAYIRISTDGTIWTDLWSNQPDDITDEAWNLDEWDISAYADDQPTVYLRWTMGTTDDMYEYSGWNIDDVEIWAIAPPEPTAACCYPDGSCAVTTEADCTGVWHSEWVDCEVAECPQSTAACCYPDGSCAVTAEADCTGVWHPEWVDCEVAECPQPGDNCALPLVVTLPAALPYHISDTLCGRGDDEQWSCMGDFVDGEDMVFALVVTEPICVDISLEDQADGYTGWAIADTCHAPAACLYVQATASNPDALTNVTLAPGTYYLLVDYWPPPTCRPFMLDITACPQPTAACCYADGSCAVTTELDCTGIWHAEWADCVVAECPQPTAACCYPDGSCAVTTEADCTGVWHAEWADCVVAECPQPTTGACCAADATCTEETEADCLANDGTYQGDGTDCDPNPCIVCPGDMDCDGDVDFDDIDPFVLSLSGEAAYLAQYPDCRWLNADCDGDGDVDFDDIDAFVGLIGTTCW